MGSMQSESKVVYSEDIYYSNVKFSLKGKGLASLIRRDMHNGKIINLKDSTVSNIDFKKKKYSIKTFNEILKDKENKDNQNENDNQDNSDNENINKELKFIISEESELINGFEAYKLTIERDGDAWSWWREVVSSSRSCPASRDDVAEMSSSILLQ